MFGFLETSTTVQVAIMIGKVLKNQCFLWQALCTDPHPSLKVCSWKDSSKMFYHNMDSKKHQRGNVCSFIACKDCSYPCTWDDIKMGGKKQQVELMWKMVMHRVDLERPTTFLDQVYLGCTQRECK